MSILLATGFDPTESVRWLALLRAALPDETISDDPAARREIEVALVASPAPGSLRGLPRLALIHSLWAGVDGLLADATVPRHVPIVRMVDPGMNAAMAETALWAVLSLHRGFFAYAERQRQGVWRAHRQRRADEITVAVLGLGQMGRTVALLLAGQGYRVAGWSRNLQAVPGIETSSGADAMAALLQRADIVVNLLPLTPQTTGLFNAERLALLRPEASLVNLARGAHVVDAALLAALDAGRLRHAVLDVFATEPLPAGHRYWSHPRVTVLPHAAAQTDARSAAGLVAANIRAWRAGTMLAHVVDRRRGY